ncbi:MAG: zf-HC2 domain-containing protein [Myxococcaceae bacterium]
MSLLFHRGAIEAAVAGTSSVEEERSLREHLASCDACRAHYDALMLTARAATGMDVTGAELSRERARLEAMLTPKPQTRSAPRWAVIALPVSLAATLAFVAFLKHEPDVVERGGTEAPAAPFSISIYAKAKSGEAPVRLVAELPASGEASLSANDWLQVTSKAQVVVVVLNDTGARVLPTGSSESLPAGTWRLFAVTDATSDEVLRAAKGLSTSTKKLPLARPQVTGVLSVQP